MKRITLLLVAGILLTAITACTKKDAAVPVAEKKQESQGNKYHGESTDQGLATVKTPTADILKKHKLGGYPQKTVGEAFDSYSKAVAKEWQEDIAKDGRYFVDYICWLDEKAVLPAEKNAGVVKKGLDIKFVIQASGEAYISMATKLFLKADGKVQTEVIPLPNVPKIVEAIYNNRELDI